MINPKNDAKVAQAAEALYAELSAAGIDTVLDDRGLRPGAMFADIELIGIPHRIVVSRTRHWRRARSNIARAATAKAGS